MHAGGKNCNGFCVHFFGIDKTTIYSIYLGVLIFFHFKFWEGLEQNKEQKHFHEVNNLNFDFDRDSGEQHKYSMRKNFSLFSERRF